MTEIECVTKKWGSSLGIIIPKEIVMKEHISEHDKIVVEIKKKRLVLDLFGSISGWKTPTQKIKDEMREGWE